MTTTPPPEPESPLSPYRIYPEAEKCPVHSIRLWNDTDARVFARYGDVRALLQDRRFSSDSRRPGFTELTPVLQSQTSAPPFVRTDNPDHRRLRGSVAKEFLPKHVERLRPAVKKIVEEVLDTVVEKGPPADLFAAFAVPVASTTVFRLLGVPRSDLPFLTECVRGVVSAADSQQDGAGSFQALGGYIDGLIREPAGLPEDSIVRRLVEGPYATGELNHGELIGVVIMLIVGGYDTTASTISLSLLSYATEPEKFAFVHSEPERAPQLVEELLRFHTVSHLGLGRMATEDLEVGEVGVKAGEMVVAALQVANRDAEVFTNPHELDFDRPSVPHVGFGYGAHQCVGQALARLELQEAIPAIIRRLPSLTLDGDMSELRFRHDMSTFGLHALPMKW